MKTLFGLRRLDQTFDPLTHFLSSPHPSGTLFPFPLPHLISHVLGAESEKDRNTATAETGPEGRGGVGSFRPGIMQPREESMRWSETGLKFQPCLPP